MGMIQQRMTDSEYQFTKYIKEVWLPNRNRIDNNMIAHAEDLLQVQHAVINCPNCAHRRAVELYNKFETLLPFYEEYEMKQKMAILENEEKKRLDEVAPKVSVPDVEEKISQPTKPKQAKTKKED